ncbi:MAG: hypothetical protein ACRD2S_01455, partial [Terriglobales bacterium]
MQRIRELDEKTSIPDNPVAGLYPAGDLRLTAKIFTQSYATPSKLVRANLDINKWLVLAVAKHSRIGQCNRIFDSSCVYRRRDVHVFLELLARIIG